RDAQALPELSEIEERGAAVDQYCRLPVGDTARVACRTGQSNAGELLLGLRVQPRFALRIAHGSTMRKANWQFIVIAFGAARDESVFVEIGWITQRPDLAKRQFRLFQGYEPFIRYAEGECALVSVVIP